MRSASSGGATAARAGARASSLGFDLIVAVLGLLVVGALHYVGWARLHVPDQEAPFALWHILAYVAFVVLALAILVTIWRGRQSGLSWRSATPPGYGMSAVGLGLGLLGIVGEIVLPAADAVEGAVGIAPLLLAAGTALAVSGPLRAAWRRSGIPSLWRTHLAMLLSIAALLSVFTYVTQSFHPFAAQLPALQYQPTAGAANEQTAAQLSETYLAAGLAGIAVQSALLMGLLLPVVRRWTVPLGSITLILVLNTALLVLMRSGLTPAGPLVMIGIALVAGILGDLVVRGLRPASDASQNFRIVAFAVPALLYLLFFLGLLFAGGGVWWSTSLWVGAAALAGIAGWLLSFVVVPTGSSEGPKFR